MSIEIINIPDLGEVEEVEVIEISVDVGQEVDNEDTTVSYTHLTLPTILRV